MEHTALFLRFGAALAIGVLIGMQREYASESAHLPLAAGVRTFPLFALIGCCGAMLADKAGSALILVAVIAVAALFFAVDYFIEAQAGRIGMTTKAAGMLTVLIGALCYAGQLTIAAALAVAVTALLSVKIELHRFVEHLTREDVYATLKFAAISAIILPVLPNRNFGPVPFTIFNPFKIWLFVVLISGISFVGYVLIKALGPKRGIGLTGLLGGLASSTAVTLSFARRSKINPELGRPFALAVTVAWTVMYGRVLVAVAVLNPALVRLLWLPVAASVAAGLIWSLVLWRSESREHEKHEMAMANPFELGLAIKFGLLFVIILFIAKAAAVYLGSTGIYLSSFFSGLADVDAIALSVAKLSRAGGGIDLLVAARAVVIAMVANTVLKGGFVMITGTAGIKKALLPGFLLMVITGLAVVWLV